MTNMPDNPLNYTSPDTHYSDSINDQRFGETRNETYVTNESDRELFERQEGVYGVSPYSNSSYNQYAGVSYGHHDIPPHPKANTVLALGIGGFFVPFLSFVGWALGKKYKDETLHGRYKLDSNLEIGYYMSMLLSILQIVMFAILFISMVLFVLAGFTVR